MGVKTYNISDIKNCVSNAGFGMLLSGIMNLVMLTLIFTAIFVDRYASLPLNGVDVHLNMIPNDAEHTGSTDSYNAMRSLYYTFLSFVALCEVFMLTRIVCVVNGYTPPFDVGAYAEYTLYSAGILSIIATALVLSLIRYSTVNLNGAVISYASSVSSYGTSTSIIFSVAGIALCTPAMSFISKTLKSNSSASY